MMFKALINELHSRIGIDTHLQSCQLPLVVTDAYVDCHSN